MAFTLDKIPLPEVESLRDESRLRLLAKILGIALVAQWFIPWLATPMGTIFSWDLVGGPMGAGFASIFSLPGGIVIGALGFMPAGLLKRGPLGLALCGVGLVGLISVTTFAGGGIGMTPLLGFFPLFGLVTLHFALLMASGRTPQGLSLGLLIAGLSLGALGLLVPIDGTMPIVFMFKVFGQSGINILWRIFAFLTLLGYIGLLGGIGFAVFVVKRLPDGLLRLAAWLAVVYLPVALLLLGFFAMFTMGWLFISALHVVVIVSAYLVLVVVLGGEILDALLSGAWRGLLR